MIGLNIERHTTVVIVFTIRSGRSYCSQLRLKLFEQFIAAETPR